MLWISLISSLPESKILNPAFAIRLTICVIHLTVQLQSVLSSKSGIAAMLEEASSKVTAKTFPSISYSPITLLIMEDIAEASCVPSTSFSERDKEIGLKS
ncbi:unnamed protein product [[Candida] boidinii]|nr:unnamed protein product [[Candida] boidinii]